MLKQTGLCLCVGALGIAACGGPSENDFSDGPASAGSHAPNGGSSGSSGSKATGGAAGASAAAGRGGSSTGGSGGSSTGGSGGSAMGGSGNGGSAGAPLGGSSGDATTGGSGMTTGGSGSGIGGTDMTTGGSGSGMGGGGGMAGKAGNGGSAGNEPSCDELATAYADALTEAKVCNANSGKDQCTELVLSALNCGCDQYVNPDNDAALDELTRLQKQAGTQCVTVCPAIACQAPGAATCESDGADQGAGHCVSAGAVVQ